MDAVHKKFIASPALRLGAFALLGFLLILISGFVDELRVYQGAEVAVYVVAIASITLLTGYSGQLSLGHGAIMAIGAYAATLSFNGWHIPWLLALAVGAVAGAIAGYILGFAAARLSGPYLAGTTLALAVGVPSLANQFHVLGGEQGLTFDIGDVPQWASNSWLAKVGGGDFTTYKWFYWITVPIALATIWIVRNILSGPLGRRFKAMRSHPTAASLIGIHVSRTKVVAFTYSSSLAGLAGAMLAMILGLSAPLVFTLTLSFTLVTGAVLSGVSNLYGGIIGAMVLVAIPELSASVATHLGGSEKVTANLPGVVTSLLLILTVLILPNGAKVGRSK